MDVRIVALKAFETAPGSPVAPGAVLILPERIAGLLVEQGKAVYYADFSVSMIKQPEPQEEPEIKETKAIKAPWKKRK